MSGSDFGASKKTKCGIGVYNNKKSEEKLEMFGKMLNKLLEQYEECMQDMPVDGSMTRHVYVANVNNNIYVLSKAQTKPLRRLSMRERQVAILVGKGLQNKEVAKSLTISPTTVGVYLQRIFSKLSINSRADLSIYGIILSAPTN
jgi:DNA-binding NarL/FixJ family response regulator